MGRNAGLDLLKLFLALFVVAIHTQFLVESYPAISYFLNNGFFRIAVPVFFVINGYFFYSAVFNNRVKTWLLKVTIMYFSWTSVYLFFWLPSDYFSLAGFLTIVKTILLGYYHLWYLSGIIFAAIMLLFFNKLKLSDSFLIKLSLMFFLCGVMIQYFGNYHVVSNFSLDVILNTIELYRNFVFFAFPFFYCGYCIHKRNLHNYYSKFKFYLLLYFGFVLLGLEAYCNYILMQNSEGFDIYLSLAIICPLLFVVVLNFELNFNTKNFSLLSSSIYLIHPLVFILIWKQFEVVGTIVTLIVTLLSVLLSYFIIKLNNRFKCFI